MLELKKKKTKDEKNYTYLLFPDCVLDKYLKNTIFHEKGEKNICKILRCGYHPRLLPF